MPHVGLKLMTPWSGVISSTDWASWAPQTVPFFFWEVTITRKMDKAEDSVDATEEEQGRNSHLLYTKCVSKVTYLLFNVPNKSVRCFFSLFTDENMEVWEVKKLVKHPIEGEELVVECYPLSAIPKGNSHREKEKERRKEKLFSYPVRTEATDALNQSDQQHKNCCLDF